MDFYNIDSMFSEYMEINGIEHWWELADSPEFFEFESWLAENYGDCVLQSDEYDKFVRQIMDDI